MLEFQLVSEVHEGLFAQYRECKDAVDLLKKLREVRSQHKPFTGERAGHTCVCGPWQMQAQGKGKAPQFKGRWTYIPGQVYPWLYEPTVDEEEASYPKKGALKASRK